MPQDFKPKHRGNIHTFYFSFLQKEEMSFKKRSVKNLTYSN